MVKVKAQLLTLNTSPEDKRSRDMKGNGAWDFPGDAVVGSPPANAGDAGTIPGSGRSHMPRSN